MSTNKSSTNENETSKLGHPSTSKPKPPSKIPSITHDNTKKVDLATVKNLIEALEEENLKSFILNFIQTNPKFKAIFIESLPKTKKGTKTPQPQESKSQITSKQIKPPKPSTTSNKPQSLSSTATKPPTASIKPSNTSNKPQTSSGTSNKPPSSSTKSLSASNKPQTSSGTSNKPPSSSDTSNKPQTSSIKSPSTSNKPLTSSNKASAPAKNQTSSTNKQIASSASKPTQTTKKPTQTANKGESTGTTKKLTSTTGKTSTSAKSGTTKPTAKTSASSKTSSKKSATSNAQKSGTKKSSSPSRPSSGHGNAAKRTTAQLKKTKSQIINKPKSTEPINKTLPKLAPSKNDLILGKDGTFQRNFDLKLVEEVKQPMLLHIKGKRKVKTSQVRCSWKSLNYGDCFILDANDVIYIWNGPQSNRMEKAKAIDVAQRIKDKERHSNASIVEVFGNDPTTASPEQLPFWKILGALNYVPAPSKNSKTPTNFAGLDIASAEKGGSDEVADKQDLVEEFTIISVEGGEIKVHTTLAPKLEKGILNSQICCVVDCGKEFYLWQGRKSTLQQRAKALEYANQLFSKEKRGDWVQLSKLMEGTEPILFQEKFVDWGTLPIAVAAPPVHFRPKAELPVFDIRILLEPISIPPPITFGDGPGQICNIWRIHEHTKELIKPEAFGQFYSAESFLILYKYPVKNREETVIYFWQGRNSTINDKGTSAYLTVELDSEEAHGEAKQIRVVQTQEPSHFLKALNGQIIIHKGKEEDHFSRQTVFVYQVHEGEYGIHVIEMDNHIRSFNSNDCYIVQIWLNDSRELQVVVWFGQGSSSRCREECQKIATKYFLAPITSITVETEEDEEVEEEEEEEEEENQDENAVSENQNEEEHIEHQGVGTIEKEEEPRNENEEDHNEKPNEESAIKVENIDQEENNDTQNEESTIGYQESNQEIETIEKEEESQHENEEDHNEKPNEESAIKVENIDQEENQNEEENVFDNEEENIANQNEENINQEEHQNKDETIENEEENIQNEENVENEERTIDNQNDGENIQNEENLDQEEYQNEIQTQDKVEGQEIKTIEKEPNILEKEIDSKLGEQIETKKENEIKPVVKAKRENKSKNENKKNEPKSQNTKPEAKFTILDIQIMNEGEEKEIFWKFIEKGEYCKYIHKRKPRLFQASNSSGRFYVDSLIYFSQADLVDEDMFFLDTEKYLFVWEGAYATVEEKKCSLAAALEYLKLIKEKENNPQKQGYYILSGKEPLEFTSCFFGWQWQKPTAFLAHFQKIQPPVNPPSLSSCPTIQEVYHEYTRTYTLAELQLKPPQLDPSKYESYLCDEEFQKLFQCSKEEFAALPSWKQKDKKKAVGLF